MAVDKEADIDSYKQLSQFYNIVKSNPKDMDDRFIDWDRRYKEMQIIIERTGDINYQYPNNDFTTLRNPQLAGCTALHLALGQERNETIVKALLRRGIDFTIKNQGGSTALHAVVERNYSYYKNRLQMEGRSKSTIADILLSAHAEFDVFDNPCDKNGVSHFHVACMVNHSSAVEFFLSKGVSVNQVVVGDFSIFLGYTPLHFAVRCCALETAEILIKYGVDVNIKDANEMTPIDLLLEQSMSIVDWIHLEGNKDYCRYFYSSYNYYNQASNLMADLEINKKMMQLLLVYIESLKYPLQFDSRGLSLFHLACTLQNTSLIEQFLRQIEDINHCIIMDSPFWPGYTALHFASNFDIEIVKFLLQHGANVEATDANGSTPFEICVQRYKPEDLHSILQSNSVWKDILLSDNKTKLLDIVIAMQDSNILDNFLKDVKSDEVLHVPSDSPLWPGCTPLHLAINFLETNKTITVHEQKTHYLKNDCEKKIKGDYIKRIEVCLKHGDDITFHDARGRTALHFAYRLQQMKVVDLLLQGHTRIFNCIDMDNLSHLYIACAFDYPQIVKELLANDNADVNIRIKSTFQWQQNRKYFVRRNCEQTGFFVTVGSTPLHIAVTTGKPQLIEILLEHGANVNARDSNGVTPLHRTLASETPREIGEILLSHPNIEEYTFNGLNYLHLAAEFYVDEVVIDRLIRQGADVNSIINFEMMAKRNFYENREIEYPGMTTSCKNMNCYQHHLAEPFEFMTNFNKFRPLHVAICRNNRKLYRILLLKHGADIPPIRPNGSTVDHRSGYGCYCNRMNLLMYNCDVPTLTRMLENWGITILHLACQDYNSDRVEYFLNNGANVNAQVKFNSPLWPGYTPMHFLVLHAADIRLRDSLKVLLAILELLLANGADATLMNAEKNTPIHVAGSAWDIDSCAFHARGSFIQLLMKSLKDFKVNPTNVDGVSHFHVACLINDVDIMEKFLLSGADVNQPIALHSSKFPGCTPLHLVLDPDFQVDHDIRFQAIGLLVRYGANVHAGDLFGNTAFHVATKHGPPRSRIFEKIFSIGTSIASKNIFGEVPLGMFLSSMRSRKLEKEDIQFFLKHDSPLIVFDPIHEEGLLTVLFPINQSISKKVMKSPGITKLDEFGRNAIHNVVSRKFTCSKSYPGVISFLVEQGCDIDHRDQFDRTPLDLAVKFENYNAVIGLLTAGADINVTNSRGNTTFSEFFSSLKNLERHQFGYQYAGIGKLMAMHILKLQMTGLYVSELNTAIQDELLKKVSLDEEQIEKVKKELKKIKDLKIESTQLSPYDFFSETGVLAAFPYMPRSEQQAINKFFTSMKKRHFKQLGYLLKIRHDKTLKRLCLLKPAKVGLNVLLKFTLPRKCSRRILRLLTNTDLENVIASIN